MSRFRKGKKASRKFDGFEWEPRTSGKQRVLYHQYIKFHNTRLDTMIDDVEEHEWCCPCGHYEESDYHCSNCGGQPPWGCDCSFCQAKDEEEREDPDNHIYREIYHEYDPE